MFKRLLIESVCLLLCLGAIGCTTYVRPGPPPARVEVRAARPNAKAAWVPGHWRWKNKRAGYKWIPGHWKRVR